MLQICYIIIDRLEYITNKRKNSICGQFEMGGVVCLTNVSHRLYIALTIIQPQHFLLHHSVGQV